MIVFDVLVRLKQVFDAVVAGFVNGSLLSCILPVDIDVALGASEIFPRAVRYHVRLPSVE